MLLGLLAAFAATGSRSAAQEPSASEYRVKAVYLFNFGKFVSWPSPPSKEDLFAVCVLGTDPFGKLLDSTLAGEEINGQKLVARRIVNARDGQDCRILFIGVSEPSRIKEILAPLEKSSVLTVGEMPGFLSNGGMIQFVIKENRVRFAVNLTAAEKAGLVLSSQLLKVAVETKRDSDNVDGKR